MSKLTHNLPMTLSLFAGMVGRLLMWRQLLWPSALTWST